MCMSVLPQTLSFLCCEPSLAWSDLCSANSGPVDACQGGMCRSGASESRPPRKACWPCVRARRTALEETRLQFSSLSSVLMVVAIARSRRTAATQPGRPVQEVQLVRSTAVAECAGVQGARGCIASRAEAADAQKHVGSRQQETAREAARRQLGDSSIKNEVSTRMPNSAGRVADAAWQSMSMSSLPAECSVCPVQLYNIRARGRWTGGRRVQP